MLHQLVNFLNFTKLWKILSWNQLSYLLLLFLQEDEEGYNDGDVDDDEDEEEPGMAVIHFFLEIKEKR